LRSCACAQTAPKIPVLAPITATGLLRQALSGNGRDAQSTAFLRAPGIEPLYSGVAIRIASAAAIARRSRSTAAGAR
jgi:hypothetical protein